MNPLAIFCRQVRARSADHATAMHLMYTNRILSVVVGILRQELDSLIRVIYLLSLSDRSLRQQLIDASVNGELWTVKGKKGKKRKVTDREMTDLADSLPRLHGWTES